MNRKQPLEGIRVVDLTRALAGPYCTMTLADMGASVIKIEKPRTGDDTRSWGPPFLPNCKDSAYFAGLNRNKKSLTLNMKATAGKEILHKLLSSADILVENFRYGTMQNLGFSYEHICEQYPKLIYCSLTGFGSTGPYAYRGGYDVIVQAMGGIMSITGQPDGDPTRVGVPIVDLTTGMNGVQGILAALYAREKTGKGQLVESSLLETQVAWLTNAASNYLISGKVPQRIGNMHANITPYQPYKTKDGHITIAIGNEKLWHDFIDVLQRPDLGEDERFCNNALRNQHRTELNEILNPIFLEKTSQEWSDAFIQKGIPAGPINTIDKVFQDPQVLARNMVEEVEHPLAGTIKVVGMPIKFSSTFCKIQSAPPLLGEHSKEILLKLGYTKEEIDIFKATQVI
ncbi:MAG TPA: CoA transferase [Planctomycetota bacterium]|nr:CoA transferase [Planctomycetota bacterium]